ncbi:MAG: hypothetical protein QOC66_1322 [Pseudonocardiales bacterium]|nr:hypothetical protein [Pseudonocardiales bacterium]
MTKRRSRIRIAAAILSATATVLGLIAGAPAAEAHSSARITSVVGGLAAPRGIAFDGRGAMYVAESGVAGAGEAGLTHTGKVDKFKLGRTSPTWSTGFDSFYAAEDPSAPPDVLGPEGLSAAGKDCGRRNRDGEHEDRGKHNDCQVYMIMSESTPGIADASGGAVNAPQAGHLYRLNGRTGQATSKSDFGSQMYQFTIDHESLFPEDFPDSNPYGVLVTRGKHGGMRTFVADAGANTISEVMRDGTIRVVSYIPNETEPPFRDSTPTCIAAGPDGYLYVGTLNFVANLFAPGGGGFSNVWRVNPNANFPTEPTLWATGLTTVTACTFDRSGNFWAAEMFAGGLDANPPGDVVRIPFRHPSRHDQFGAGRLAVPGGIAQGPDGAMYVTVGSSAPGVNGGVMRVSTRHHHDD